MPHDPLQAVLCKLTGLEAYEKDQKVIDRLVEISLGKTCIAAVDDRLDIHSMKNTIVISYHCNDITRRVTWSSGSSGWQNVFVWRALRYFVGIRSLFAFTLLTYKIMVLFGIGVGYIGIV